MRQGADRETGRPTAAAATEMATTTATAIKTKEDAHRDGAETAFGMASGRLLLRFGEGEAGGETARRPGRSRGAS